MENKSLTIGEAAKQLGVSVDTLRRWDRDGKLVAKKSAGGHRYYDQLDLELFKKDIFALATEWVLGPAKEPEAVFYCPTSSDYKGRLSKLQSALEKLGEFRDYYPLIVAVVGEIGNNSFDHNLGNWPDISGIYFSFDLNKRQVALADRGQGVLRTLKKVRSEIKNDEEALRVAFTEKLSGRAPESRGNGLKFVLQIVLERNIQLEFYSGGAKASVVENGKTLDIKKTDTYYSGCLALIRY